MRSTWIRPALLVFALAVGCSDQDMGLEEILAPQLAKHKAQPGPSVLLPSGYTRVTLLPTLPPNSVGGAVAMDINDRGVVVGHMYADPEIPDGSASVANAVSWNRCGEMTMLAAAYSYAWAINDRGAIAGYTNDGESTNHAWVIEGKKQIRIGADDESTVALDLNGRGQVVGIWAWTQGAWFWSREGGIVDLPPHNGSPWGVNDAGQVAGSYTNEVEGPKISAFVWDAATGVTDLGQILECSVAESDRLCSEAWDINNQGQVVGRYRVAPSLEDHPFV